MAIWLLVQHIKTNNLIELVLDQGISEVKINNLSKR
jgi:hypothetical protein